MMIGEEPDRVIFELPSDATASVLNVYKIYKEDELETVALGGVSLTIREGEILVVVGPSGSGKTTLLGILGGIVQPTSGLVYWSTCGSDITRLNPEEVIRVRRTFLGFVFQEANLISHLTVLQNVELTRRIAGLPDPTGRARRLLERVGLGDSLGLVPGMLSTGERQRVAIASALVVDPKLVLADEPTGNVDSYTSEELLNLFKELNREIGTAFFIVTHSQQVAAVADRILEIRDGVLVGSHTRGADLKDLDKSRIVNLDDLGRITIPRYILNQLNRPRGFKVKTERGEIVLTPYTERRERVKMPILVCRVCGTLIKDQKINTCPKCRSILPK